MEINEEKILDGTKLDMSVKLQTILKTYDELGDGETFILHNDHDPKPLQSVLSAQHGDQLTWEYVKQNPNDFEVRIGKKALQPASNGNEKVLDGICLDPKVKFQTIMQTFDDLKEGEAFILHNDHDPKPLFYQLSATKGDIFTWDYLQQGPEIFEIRIAKKNLPKEAQTSANSSGKTERFNDHIEFPADAPETVRTIVAKDERKIAVFKKYDIDYAWNANIPLDLICEANDIDENQLRKELKAVETDFSNSIPSRDYYHWEMAFLADYILQTHHQYVKDNAERISKLAEDCAAHDGMWFAELLEIGGNVRPMIDDFLVHMSKEEDVLFPAIKQMLKVLEKGEKSKGPGGAIKNAVIKMEEEHDETKAYLDRFRQLSDVYAITERMSERHRQLYRDLQLFENDTNLHVHLENNILFPKLILLEKLITE